MSFCHFPDVFGSGTIAEITITNGAGATMRPRHCGCFDNRLSKIHATNLAAADWFVPA